jgi:hypothetical protein
MPRRATERLTDKLVRALAVPTQGATITYDAEVPGFGARITATGARAFVLNYRCAGRERRMTIGRFPTWSTTAAREEARELRRKVDSGIDPMLERELSDAAGLAERAAPTMQHLFARYQREHLPRKAPRAAADDASMWQNTSCCPAWAAARSPRCDRTRSMRCTPRSAGRGRYGRTG